MDRKDFVKNVGVGLMLLLGGSMIINALTGTRPWFKKDFIQLTGLRIFKLRRKITL